MRTRLALLAAVVLGILAAIGVRMYVTQTEREVKGRHKRVAIATARRTLNRGDFLKDSDVSQLDVEVQAIREDHILHDERRRWLGMKLTRKVPAGKPILQSDFLAAEPVAPAEDKIDTKWRAVTIGTDQIAGVAGLITPGSRVDILSTFRMPSRGPQAATTTVTKIIARNVEVIAVDQRTDVTVPVGGRPQTQRLDSTYSSVTLHVLPLEAALLTFAQETGKITFVLRNTGDQYVPREVPSDVTINALPDLIMEAEQRRQERVGAEPNPSP